MVEFEDEFFQNISFDSDSASKTSKHRPKANVVKAKKSPKGGYRPILVDQAQLNKEAAELEPQIRHVIYEVSMSDQDKASYFTLAYLNQRYPSNFLESLNPIVKSATPLVMSRLLSDIPLKFKSDKVCNRLKSLNICSLFDVVNSFDLHSVPYSARFTLVNWYLDNKFDLVLFVNKIPSSKQVLTMQANSKRCVSLISKLYIGLRSCNLNEFSNL